MAGIPWWMAPVMAMMGRRPTPAGPQVPSFRPAQMGTAAPRRMMSANDNSRNPNDVPMPLLNTGNQSTLSTGGPSQSHVGRLNALSPQQFQVYMDARSRGMTPAQAMAAAQGQ